MNCPKCKARPFDLESKACWVCGHNLAPEPAFVAESSSSPAHDSANTAAAEAVREVIRATQKFPTWPTDPIHALAVVHEELGELNCEMGRLDKEVLQLCYEPDKSSLTAVRVEAIQTAAMALRFFMSLDQYKFLAGPQHFQNAEVSDSDPLSGAFDPKPLKE